VVMPGDDLAGSNLLAQPSRVLSRPDASRRLFSVAVIAPLAPSWLATRCARRSLQAQPFIARKAILRCVDLRAETRFMRRASSRLAVYR